MKNQKPVLFAFCFGMAWLLSGCMTTAQEKEMSDLQTQVDILQKQSKQREQQLSSATQTSQNVQTDLDDLKSQNAQLQGGVDELKMRIKKIEETAGSTSQAAASTETPSSDALLIIERRIARLELLNADTLPKTAKLPAKLKDVATVEKLLKADFDNSRFDDVIKISSIVINAVDAKPQAVAIALEYRGEAKFNQRNYRGAAIDLSSFVESFPTHKRYPRALILAGDSFFYLKKPQVALGYYSECKSSYTNTAEGKAAGGRMTSLTSQMNGNVLRKPKVMASADPPAPHGDPARPEGAQTHSDAPTASDPNHVAAPAPREGGGAAQPSEAQPSAEQPPAPAE